MQLFDLGLCFQVSDEFLEVVLYILFFVGSVAIEPDTISLANKRVAQGAAELANERLICTWLSLFQAVTDLRCVQRANGDWVIIHRDKIDLGPR